MGLGWAKSGADEVKLRTKDSASAVMTIVPSTLAVTFHGTVTSDINPGSSDDALTVFGTDGDGVIVNRSTILNANTALTGVVVGTPVVPALAANTLVIANKTADGDIVLIHQTGGNSHAVLWADASAGKTFLYGGAGVEAVGLASGLTVINETGADVDTRVEGDTNANMVVVDAGTDSMSLGSAVVAGAALSISNLTGRTVVTAVGVQLHIPAGSFTDGGVTGTIAELDLVRIGAQTIVATNTITYTDVASLVVTIPVASTGATFTRTYAIWAKGQIRTLSNIQIGDNTAAFASTQPTGSAVFQSQVAPVGAIVTGGAIYTSATVMRKIVAAGTDSAIG